MRDSKTLKRLREGKPVFCLKSIYADPDICELMGLLGTDVIWICNEHLALNPERLRNVCRAGRAGNVDIMVRRVPGHYDDLIQLLEMGATGLMIPHCVNAQMAREIIRETKFYPVGRRGVDGISADSDFGLATMEDYMGHANRETFVMVQIEDREAIDHIEEIAAVDGVDIVFVGPADLSHSLGVPGQFKHPLVQDAIARTVKACQANGKWCGTSGLDYDYIGELLDKGVRFITMGSDYGMIKSGFKAMLEKLHQIEGDH